MHHRNITGKGWWGQLGTFMISRPTYQGSDWWKFSIWNIHHKPSV